MRRSIVTRIITAIWAVWLGAALSEPMAIHPMAIASAGQMASMPSMPGMPGMDGAIGTSGAQLAHKDMPSHGSSAACTCQCDCCCAAPISLVDANSAHIDAPEPLDSPVATVPAAQRPAAPVPHSLPFANGPPSAQLA